MKKVYFDHAAGNPLLPDVLKAMVSFMETSYGNPAAIHDWGDDPREALEEARNQVASLIGGRPEEIIFTGSATESNNFAVKGLALARKKKGRHVIVSAIEHFSVLYAARTLEKWGFEVSFAPVDGHGLLDPEEVRRLIRKETTLISVMHGNGEVGTVEPIEEIAKIAREHDVVFHTDAVATAGTIPVDVDRLGLDALSLAGNQFYGPVGAAALWVRKGVRIMPLLDGGVQEGGRRAGTENIPAIVGLGVAAKLARVEMEERLKKLTPLRDLLIEGIPEKVNRVVLTGHPTIRLPNHASFCVEFIEGEAMLMLLNSSGFAAASGSACTSRALKASHVLLAMGLPHELAQGSVVFTLGLENNREEVEDLLGSLPQIIGRLRDMSPLYAKFLKGVKG